MSPSYILKTKAIKTFGNSMMPLLQDGDIVFLNKKKFHLIRVNDIICVRKNRGIFTHRVIYKTNKYLITRGDANHLSDGKIYPKNVVGIVSKVKRGKQIFGINDLYFMQSSIYFAQVLKVKNKLDKAKILYVFPKGLPVYMYYEGTHPKRIYVDSDILVEAINLQKIRKIFSFLGYHEIDTSLSNMQSRLSKKKIKASFYKNVYGFPVVFDLHFEAGFMMTQLGNLNTLYSQGLIEKLMKKFLAEARKINIDGEDISLLSNSNQVIFYALHIFHHNFRGGYRFDFLANFVKKQKINYEDLSEIILDYKLKNFVYPSFVLLDKYYSVRFPKKFIESIRPNKNSIKLINREVLKTNLFDEEGRIESGIKRFKNRFFLSPNTLRKYLVFFDPQVFYAIFWIVKSKIRRQVATLKLSF